MNIVEIYETKGKFDASELFGSSFVILSELELKVIEDIAAIKSQIETAKKYPTNEKKINSEWYKKAIYTHKIKAHLLILVQREASKRREEYKFEQKKHIDKINRREEYVKSLLKAMDLYLSPSVKKSILSKSVEIFNT